MIARLNVLLLLLMIGSALWLVRVQYDSRRLYSELDREVSLARQLEIDSDRLKVAVRAQAAATRVESFAREQLKMQSASPTTTHYVPDPSPAPASANAVAPAATVSSVPQVVVPAAGSLALTAARAAEHGGAL